MEPSGVLGSRERHKCAVTAVPRALQYEHKMVVEDVFVDSLELELRPIASISPDMNYLDFELQTISNIFVKMST